MGAGKAHARAALLAAGREKRLERLVEHLRRHSLARVTHGQRHAPRRAVRRFRVPRFNLEAAAGGHRVARVRDEIEQHALEFHGVDRHAILRGAERDRECRALACHQLELPPELVDELVERHGLGRHRLTPAEREQVGRHGRRAHRGRSNLAQIVVRRVRRLQVVRDEIDAPADDVQQVAEVVRHRARDARHRVHPPGLIELLAKGGLARLDLLALAREQTEGEEREQREADEGDLDGHAPVPLGVR